LGEHRESKREVAEVLCEDDLGGVEEEIESGAGEGVTKVLRLP